MLCFSLILGSPWALHGMGSHAIRTRLCSRNTLFRFCIFFLKNRLHMTSFWLHFGTVFSQQSQFWVKKELQKKVQKRWPPCRKQDPVNTAGGSRTGSHYQELFEQEIIVRTHVEAIVPVFSLKMWIRLKIALKSKKIMIWHALGKGPANYLSKIGPIWAPTRTGPLEKNMLFLILKPDSIIFS